MKESASVKKVGDSTFEFQFPDTAKEEKKIYLLTSPQWDSQDRCVAVTKEESLKVTLSDLDFRPYFDVKIGSKRRMVAERNLPVDGMNNFRDMGGYATKDGKHVKWGRLYRSDHIYNATEQGLEYLRKLGIHTIIDYRSMDEVRKYPNKIIADNVKTYCLDPSAHTAELAAQFTSTKDNEDENLVKKFISQKEKGCLKDRYDIVIEQYRNFVCKEQSKDAFGKMVKIAADPKASAIVQHCRGGKDRTGFGCMLLLGLLGVKKEDLVEDYMLTHHNRMKRNQIKMEIYKRFTNDPTVLEYLYSLIDTKAEFIEASYDVIMDTYHSFEAYAEKELDISRRDVLQLRENYLE